jgi:hypothetical protein
MRSNGEAGMGHIRLLSWLHCAISRARSICRIIRITTFHASSGLNKRGSLHLSDAASSLSAVIPEILLESRSALFQSAAKICTATHAHAAHAHGHHHGHHDRLLLHHCASPILFDPPSLVLQ